MSIGEGGGGHNRMVRHVRTPLYRPRGVISGFEIVLRGVILPPFHLLPAASFFSGVRIRLGTILGRFSIIYFRGLGLRIRVRVWVGVRVRVRVWVSVRVGVRVRVSVVL